MVHGRTRSVPGLGKAARENFRTKEAWPERLTTYCTVRGMTCQTLEIDVPSVYVLIQPDPTLPRYGTDFIPHPPKQSGPVC